jgi:hypothetical protein
MGSLQSWYAESAQDADEELDIIAGEAKAIAEKAKAVSSETGIPLARALDLVQMRAGFAPEMSVASPDADVDAPQPLVALIGVGGTQAVNEVMMLVSTGAMPKENAIAYISNLTGQPRNVVAEWIPDAKPVAPVATAPKAEPAAPAMPAVEPRETGFRAQLKQFVRRGVMERKALQAAADITTTTETN